MHKPTHTHSCARPSLHRPRRIRRAFSFVKTSCRPWLIEFSCRRHGAIRFPGSPPPPKVSLNDDALILRRDYTATIMIIIRILYYYYYYYSLTTVSGYTERVRRILQTHIRRSTHVPTHEDVNVLE